MKETIEISALSTKIAQAYAEISYQNPALVLQQLRTAYSEAEAASTHSTPLGELLKDNHSSLQTVKDALQAILQAANKDRTELKQFQASAKNYYQQYPNKNSTVADLEPLAIQLENLATQVKIIKRNLDQKSQEAKSLLSGLREKLYAQVSVMQNQARTYKEELKNAYELYQSSIELTQGKALKQAKSQIEKMQTNIKAIEANMAHWPYAPFSGNFELLKNYWLQTRTIFLSLEKRYKDTAKLSTEIEKQRKLIQPQEAFALAEHPQMKSLAERIIQHWIYYPCKGLTELVAFLMSAYTALPANTELDQFHALSVFIQEQEIGEDLHLFAPNQRVIPQQIWYDALKQYLNAILQDKPNYQKKSEKDYFFYADCLFSTYENNYKESLELRILRIKELLLIWSEAARKLHRVIGANLQLELYQAICTIFQNKLKMLSAKTIELCNKIAEVSLEITSLEDEKKTLAQRVSNVEHTINLTTADKAEQEKKFNACGGENKVTELKNKVTELKTKLTSAQTEEEDKLRTQLRNILPLRAQINAYTASIEERAAEKQQIIKEIATIDSTLTLSRVRMANLEKQRTVLGSFARVLNILSKTDHITQTQLLALSQDMSSYPTAEADPVLFDAAQFWPEILKEQRSLFSTSGFFEQRLRMQETMNLQAALSQLSNFPSGSSTT